MAPCSPAAAAHSHQNTQPFPPWPTLLPALTAHLRIDHEVPPAGRPHGPQGWVPRGNRRLDAQRGGAGAQAGAQLVVEAGRRLLVRALRATKWGGATREG